MIPIFESMHFERSVDGSNTRLHDRLLYYNLLEGGSNNDICVATRNEITIRSLQ